MSSDRASWLRRRLGRSEAEVAAEEADVVAEDPEVVAEVMQAATQRLRDQAWKISATTRAVLIPEEAARNENPAESSGPAPL